MNELIHIHNQGPELRADSREVAKAFGIQHESLVKLITNHEPQLEQLGVFRFEIGKPPKGSEGGRPER
jgi:phage regulator Rha-like protein